MRLYLIIERKRCDKSDGFFFKNAKNKNKNKQTNKKTFVIKFEKAMAVGYQFSGGFC